MAYTAKYSIILWALGAILVLTNVATTVLNYHNRSKLRTTLHSYSFVDDDYPAYYPITLSAVTLTPEDTVHYHIWENDTSHELDAMFPGGGGFLYLGPDKRPFGVAMYHQMHCLMRIQRALAEGSGNSGHVHHCFNYLREAVLCDANPTLEPVVGGFRSRAVNSEIPRTCKDWEAVHALIERNHEEVVEGGEVWW